MFHEIGSSFYWRQCYMYFGARYYDNEVSVWLSVDPLSDKYPSMSPYMYCAGNPIILKDPDGRIIVPTNEGGKIAVKALLNKYNKEVLKKVFKVEVYMKEALKDLNHE